MPPCTAVRTPIAALEAARDLDRNTPDGKQAFAERERLRTARRQARTME